MRFRRTPRCFNFRRHPYPVRTEARGYAVINGRTVRLSVCRDSRCRRKFFTDL
jgi:hypothetical protein